MRFVIIDTSSILFGFEHRRDVFEVARRRFPGKDLLISAGVISEISKKSSNRGKKGAAAKTALEAIKYKKVEVDNNTQHVDDWIFGKSLEYPDSVVITNDTALIKRLRAKGVLACKLTLAGVLK